MVKTIPYSFDNKAGIEHEINQDPAVLMNQLKQLKCKICHLNAFCVLFNMIHSLKYNYYKSQSIFL